MIGSEKGGDGGRFRFRLSFPMRNVKKRDKIRNVIIRV